MTYRNESRLEWPSRKAIMAMSAYACLSLAWLSLAYLYPSVVDGYILEAGLGSATIALAATQRWISFPAAILTGTALSYVALCLFPDSVPAIGSLIPVNGAIVAGVAYHILVGKTVVRIFGNRPNDHQPHGAE